MGEAGVARVMLEARMPRVMDDDPLNQPPEQEDIEAMARWEPPATLS